MSQIVGKQIIPEWCKLDKFACLPPTLDLLDYEACWEFYDAHADKAQRKALNVASIHRMIAISQSSIDKLDVLNDKLDKYINYTNSVGLVKHGGPLVYNVKVDGKTYPDDMPDQYTKLSTFDDIMSLPLEYLHKWLSFHKQKYIQDHSHVYKAKLLFVARGGTMNDCVRKYEREEEGRRPGVVVGAEAKIEESRKRKSDADKGRDSDDTTSIDERRRRSKRKTMTP
ncbi:hypothetical protein V866_002314 [Kwoniella sp. B9012]